MSSPPDSTERPNRDLKGVQVQHADHVRQLIAVWLLAMLTGTIAAAIILVGFGHLWGLDVAEARPVLEILFTAVVTLVSSAVGFYFGQKSKERPDGTSEGGDA